jgi:hypothetical protein
MTTTLAGLREGKRGGIDEPGSRSSNLSPAFSVRIGESS